MIKRPELPKGYCVLCKKESVLIQDIILKDYPEDKINTVLQLCTSHCAKCPEDKLKILLERKIKQKLTELKRIMGCIGDNLESQKQKGNIQLILRN